AEGRTCDGYVAPEAHSIAVDAAPQRISLPLGDVNAPPLLRVARLLRRHATARILGVTIVTLTRESGLVHYWVLLLYKVLPEPSARRVYVWRKLKRLGAILLHDAVWVLPATPLTREQFQWLATEIEEMEGTALVWEASLRLERQDNALVDRFASEAETGYRDILAALGRPDADRATLSKQYQQIQSQDYFHVALGAVVREALAVA